MPKFTDTQLIILSTAVQREDGAALPLPKSIKLRGGAINHVLKSLLNKGLLAEQPAGHDALAWREAKDGHRLMLVITDAGRAAIGVPAGQLSEPTPSITSRGSKRWAGRHRRAGKQKGASTPKSTAKKLSRTSPRADSKQDLLVDLLRRKEGATIAEAVTATGWQPHSVRGAISGTLKKRLGLAAAGRAFDGGMTRATDRNFFRKNAEAHRVRRTRDHADGLYSAIGGQLGAAGLDALKARQQWQRRRPKLGRNRFASCAELTQPLLLR